MSAPETVRFTVENGIATITLARPEKLNALDAGMIAALARIVDRLDHDGSIRVAILTGEGKAFCAGGDIAAWGALPSLEMGQIWVRDGHRVFDHLARLKMPLIAAINGHALGGGLEIAATADIRIGEEQGKYGLPETGIGMVPGWSGTQRIVQRFGANVVRRLALTGEIITAARAMELGLIDEVVPKGTVLERAMALANQIRTKSPVATTLTKQLINAAEGDDVAATLEILAGALITTTADRREGVAAFLEKRPANFEDLDR